MELDWRGVERSAAQFGDQGDKILLLAKGRRISEAALDAATPEDDGEGPASGPWFPTPQGWVLVLEGFVDDLRPWVEELQANLNRADVEGTLTGARSVSEPSWARAMGYFPHWRALMGYLPVPDRPHVGWGSGQAVLDAVVAHAVTWTSAHKGLLVASISQGRVKYWADAATARTQLRDEAANQYVAGTDGYQAERRDVRSATLGAPGEVSFSTMSDLIGWAESIDELRAALVNAPRDRLALAMISNTDWASVSDAKGTADYCDGPAFQAHPERWDEFVPDAQGIQILTDKHLFRAYDLTDWVTTRLDDHHFLVETRDLAAWYAVPRNSWDPLDPDLLATARRDFGDMVLTPAIAEQEGLHQPG